MRGFVSIWFDPDSKSKPTTILNRISQVEHVQFTYLVTGGVDAIAFIDTPDSNAFRDTIMAIYGVGGVSSTNTNVAL